jgi:hypothetical protein
MKQFYLSADGVTYTGSSAWGIYVSSDTFLSSPSFDYNEYSVPAKNGSLISYNKRMNNIIRRFDCYINASVDSNLSALKKYVYTHPGYLYIKSDYDTECYMLGYLAQEMEVTPFNRDGNYSAQFSLYFSCRPQKIKDDSGTESITALYLGYDAIYRTDPHIQQVFSKLSNEDIPDDIIFLRTIVSSSAQTFTGGISASWNGGNDFFAVYEADGDNVVNVIGSGLNSLSITSAFSTTNALYMVCGYRDSGRIALTHHGATITSPDLDTNMLTFTTPDCVGIDLGVIRATLTRGSGTGNARSSFIVRRFVGAQFIDAGIINIKPTDNFSPGAYEQSQTVNFEIDTNALTAKMTRSGLQDVNVSDYVNIEGEMNGMCDTFTIQLVLNGSIWRTTSGQIAYPVWWKV